LTRYIGFLVVLGAVLGGFTFAGGNVISLVQPAEFIVLLGAAFGSILISLSPAMLAKTRLRVAGVFGATPFTRAMAEQLLQLLYHLTIVVKREGVIALEGHLRDPKASTIFSNYPLVGKNHHVMHFIVEALTLQVDGAVSPEDLKGILERELDTHHAEEGTPAAAIARVGDAFPGLGIVAAVLGIIVTMKYMAHGAEAVGKHVAAALVGTFLGVLLSYGFVGPIAAAMEQELKDETNFFEAIAIGMTAFAQGKAPVVVTEVARRALFTYNRPGREEIEEKCKSLRAA
jgi:chemotaxis protein MotA